MKTKLTMVLLAMILFFTVATAQEIKNMEFMGIPISGNVSDFSNKLKSKGFSLLPETKGYITLAGKFTNRDVIIVLIPIDGTNDIYRVCVIYEPTSSWDNLESHQNYLVEQFTKKYGEPSDSVRDIHIAYRNSGNNIFIGFYNGSVKYSDTWNLPNGGIQIIINTVSIDSATITIIYEDIISAKILEESIMNDI